MASQLQKKLIHPGNNVDYPAAGDEVTIEYTGWLYDAAKSDSGFKGNQ
jgi:FK506-binding protein 1